MRNFSTIAILFLSSFHFSLYFFSPANLDSTSGYSSTFKWRINNRQTNRKLKWSPKRFIQALVRRHILPASSMESLDQPYDGLRRILSWSLPVLDLRSIPKYLLKAKKQLIGTLLSWGDLLRREILETTLVWQKTHLEPQSKYNIEYKFKFANIKLNVKLDNYGFETSLEYIKLFIQI